MNDTEGSCYLGWQRCRVDIENTGEASLAQVSLEVTHFLLVVTQSREEADLPEVQML